MGSCCQRHCESEMASGVGPKPIMATGDQILGSIRARAKLRNTLDVIEKGPPDWMLPYFEGTELQDLKDYSELVKLLDRDTVGPGKEFYDRCYVIVDTVRDRHRAADGLDPE